MKKISLFFFALFVSFFDYTYSMDKQESQSCLVTFHNDIKRPAYICAEKKQIIIAPNNETSHWYSLASDVFYETDVKIEIKSGEIFLIQTREFRGSDTIIKMYTPQFKENVTSDACYTIPLSCLYLYYEEADKYTIDVQDTPLNFFVEKQT